MRTLTGAMFASLDGVVQAPGGPNEDPTGGFAHGGWATGYFDETLLGTIGEWFTPPYALLLGRRTYDIFAAHWPFATGDDAAMGEALIACYETGTPRPGEARKVRKVRTRAAQNHDRLTFHGTARRGGDTKPVHRWPTCCHRAAL